MSACADEFLYGIDVATLIDEMYRFAMILFYAAAGGEALCADYKNAAQRTGFSARRIPHGA